MSTGETGVDALPTKEGTASTIGAEVRAGMLGAVARWLETQGKMDVRAERMAMFHRIDDALPPGKLKDWHGRGQWLAEQDAKVAGWSGRGKDALWRVAKVVIAAEFPPVLLLLDNAPSILDAWSARLGGFIGEAMIKGAVSGRARIDQAMAAITSGRAMRPLMQGGMV